jgi:hypothetical protein
MFPKILILPVKKQSNVQYTQNSLKINLEIYKLVFKAVNEGNDSTYPLEAEKIIDAYKKTSLKHECLKSLIDDVTNKKVTKNSFLDVQKELENTLASVLSMFQASPKNGITKVELPRRSSSSDRLKMEEPKPQTKQRKSLRNILLDFLPFECGTDQDDPTIDTPLEKTKSIKKIVYNVIGKDIDEATAHGDKVPRLFDFLVKHLKENECHKVEGIFRVSGRKNLIESLLIELDQGMTVDYEKYRDINIFACVLKQYLRSLPSPLLTYELYPEFLRAFSFEEDKQIEEIKRLLKLLSRPRLNVLHSLLELLVEISDNSKESMMGTSNLAVVFAVTLMKPKEGALEDEVKAAQQVTRIMEEMIINYIKIKPIFEEEQLEDILSDLKIEVV